MSSFRHTPLNAILRWLTSENFSFDTTILHRHDDEPNKICYSKGEWQSDTELLQTILSRIEGLEKLLAQQDKHRVETKEFAAYLGLSIPTLYARINEELIKKLMKNGKLSY